MKNDTTVFFYLTVTELGNTWLSDCFQWKNYVNTHLCECRVSAFKLLHSRIAAHIFKSVCVLYVKAVVIAVVVVEVLIVASVNVLAFVVIVVNVLVVIAVVVVVGIITALVVVVAVVVAVEVVKAIVL